jgi:hypothetical protein
MNLNQQVTCLRERKAKDLSDAMRATANEQWFNIGVQSDSILFPSPGFAGLKEFWKVRKKKVGDFLLNFRPNLSYSSPHPKKCPN